MIFQISFGKQGEAMQYIIYTNNKREGANYKVDRIVFSDKIDVGQLIQNQMERYSISHIHFWFVRDNITKIEGGKEQNLLINFGKYLIQNKDSDFRFLYIVEKYQMSLSKKEGEKIKNLKGSQVEQKQKITKRQEAFNIEKQQIIKEQINFKQFRQFEIFIQKELKSNLNEEIIKTYIFKNKQQSITISFFYSHQKDLITNIIQEDSNRVYNAKLHYRKISTIHPEDYQKNKKVFNLEQPIQQYHRVILYLYSDVEKCDEREKKRKGFKASANLQEGLQPWKIKDEPESIVKYEKQCELIKQQIESEKIIFRNKIKLIENYIGDTINVEKLFQQEEQVNGTSFMAQQMSNTMTSPTFKKVPLAKRSSIAPTVSSGIQKLGKYNTSGSNFLPVSEFKRLKEISEAMRNIDNTIFQQNRKIEQLKGKIKELQKSKEQILFKNAKQFNQIKRQILQITQDITRKDAQIREKKKSGEFNTYLQYKNKQPTEKAKQNLKEHIKHLSLYYQQNNFNKSQQQNQSHSKLSDNSSNRKQFQEINDSALKLREKRVKQVIKTNQLMKKMQQKSSELNEARYGHKKKFSSNLKGQQKEYGKLTSHLSQLHSYFQRNCELIKKIRHQISNYKCLSNDNILLVKSKPSAKATDPFSQLLVNSLPLSKYPILKAMLDMQKCTAECNIIQSAKEKSAKQQFYYESSYGQDCFSLMIRSDKSKMKNNFNSIRSSLKQTDNQKIIQPLPTTIEKLAIIEKPPEPIIKKPAKSEYPLIKPSKFKRMTIEQALNPNLLRRVRVNEDENK